MSLSAKLDYNLVSENGILQLIPSDKKKGGALFVDFAAKSMEYRRNSSGVNQEIAKAIGCKFGERPSVLDATAGLGNDAFILASLGCRVILVENNPVIYDLLADGIRRAADLQDEVGRIVREKLYLIARQNSVDFLANSSEKFDVIYLDPMFPDRKKSAKVKKSMQYFQEIVGYDLAQEAQLLNLALEKSEKRVVVKRRKLAPFLAGKEPNHQIKGKTIRYDIYLQKN